LISVVIALGFQSFNKSVESKGCGVGADGDGSFELFSEVAALLGMVVEATFEDKGHMVEFTRDSTAKSAASEAADSEL